MKNLCLRQVFVIFFLLDWLSSVFRFCCWVLLLVVLQVPKVVIKGNHSRTPGSVDSRPGRTYRDGWDLSQPMHTVSFDWFLSGLEWILNFMFCLLKRLIFYQKVLWNIRSRLNFSTFWVFEPVFEYVWSKSSFFVHKASILIKHI